MTPYCHLVEVSSEINSNVYLFFFQGDMSEEDLLKAMQGMGLGEGEEDAMFMMQGLMKNLLSKEVLLPSLTEISEKVGHMIIVVGMLIKGILPNIMG